MKSNSLDILKKKGTGFKVPLGYFDTVEDIVMSELIAEKFPEKPGFAVPKGYFEAIEDAFTAKLSAEHLPVKEGFATPEGYFDSVENAVFTKLDKEASEKSSSDVPDGYFDTLEDRVFARIHEESTAKEPKVITLGARIRKVWAPIAVAASLVLLFIIAYNNSSDTAVNEIASTEVDEWIDEGLLDLDSYEIAEVFSDIDLASNETNSEDDDLLDYLNGTDVESMLLEN